MKKTLVSALTAALVVGAASTTFAAANPFSDVPSDHWAYDAVSQLAADGVIEGYGDTTFQGDKNITRYEMAQMVAKAMAKASAGNVSGADKALVDKLAAEFSDELNNLGVRVANLERNADKVKWNGVMENTWTRQRVTEGSNRTDDRNYNMKFRLEPSAEVNNHWHVNARLDADTKANTDAGENGSDKVSLKRVWAQGEYAPFTVKAGKFAQIDSDSLFDSQFSGAEVSYNKANWTVTAGAGRWSKDSHFNDAANYQYYGLGYQLGKLSAGADFHEFSSDDIKAKGSSYANSTTDQADIWLLKGTYTFDQNAALNGFYAENHDADSYEKAGSVEFDYKGAAQENKGTWGAWVAYRHLGDNVAFAPTYDVVGAGQKAWEIGTNYVPFKNVVATFRYGQGKELKTDNDVKNLFGRVEFFF